MLAREYFEGIRAEVLAVAREQERLDRMRRDGLSITSPRCDCAGGSHGAGASSPMDRVDAMIDAERRLRRRRSALVAEISDACKVLYGKSGRGGLARVMGTYYADVVYLVYTQGLDWPAAAAELQFSATWCRELSALAFARMDEFGFATLKET